MNERARELILRKQSPHQPDDDAELQALHAVDPRDFQFMKLSRRVCLIQRDDAGEATGFLVGPDLMLTAAHALRGTAGVFADPATVAIKFDQFIWNEKPAQKRRGTSAS